MNVVFVNLVHFLKSNSFTAFSENAIAKLFLVLVSHINVLLQPPINADHCTLGYSVADPVDVPNPQSRKMISFCIVAATLLISKVQCY